MKSRFSSTFCFCFLTQLLFTTTVSFSQQRATDSLELQQVIHDFQASIESKDSALFYKLFFSDEVSFVGIMSPETEGSIKKDFPEFEGIAVSTNKKFIRDICLSSKQQSEDFHNVVFSGDRNIASISFDYGFYSTDNLLQWGHEKWNLVKIDQRWTITDVIYSIHFPDIEPFPFKNSR